MFALFSIVLIIAQAYTYYKSINAQYILSIFMYIVNRHTHEIDVYLIMSGGANRKPNTEILRKRWTGSGMGIQATAERRQPPPLITKNNVGGTQ